MKWFKEYPSFFLALFGFLLMATGFFITGQDFAKISLIFGFSGWVIMLISVVFHIKRYFINSNKKDNVNKRSEKPWDTWYAHSEKNGVASNIPTFRKSLANELYASDGIGPGAGGLISLSSAPSGNLSLVGTGGLPSCLDDKGSSVDLGPSLEFKGGTGVGPSVGVTRDGIVFGVGVQAGAGLLSLPQELAIVIFQTDTLQTMWLRKIAMIIGVLITSFSMFIICCILSIWLFGVFGYVFTLSSLIAGTIAFLLFDATSVAGLSVKGLFTSCTVMLFFLYVVTVKYL